jgi:hypothetical protein
MAKFTTTLLMKPAVQRLLGPFGRIPTPKKWVFIVGCYNSGTTLLADLMGHHPAISALPVEGVRLSDVWPLPETYAWNRMWMKCLDEMRLKPGPGMEKTAERVKRQWSFSFARKPLLLEKSIANTPRMPFIQTYFQPAYFIYIVRNGYAVSEGLRRGAKPMQWGRDDYGEQYPIELCAQQWACTDRIVSQDRPDIDHLIEISYEALTEDPRTTLDRVTGFLDLDPFTDQVLEKSWRVHGVTSRIRDMNAEAIARLSESDIAAVRSAAADVLDKFGHLPA